MRNAFFIIIFLTINNVIIKAMTRNEMLPIALNVNISNFTY